MPKVKDDKICNVLAHKFDEALDIIGKIHPKLSKLMQEKSELLKDFPFFIVNYPFGAKIINKRDVYLPLASGGSVSINDTIVPENIRDHLGYTSGVDNPVGMILDKESEFYQPFGQRIVSYPVIKTGQIFGFAQIIDKVMNNNAKTNKKKYVSTWNLDAGARTSFLLPKISENGRHTNLLNLYKIEVEKPTTYIEQSKVFSALNKSIETPWIQPVLYFSKQFSEALIKPECAAIFQEMANIHRSGYTIWHNAYANWESDINYVFQEAKVNKLSSYAINIVKHIYLILAGGAPGFAPATSEQMLPKKLIETAYTQKDGYALTEYWPVIIQPQHFNDKEAVYYSLSLPTLINYNPESFGGKTSIALLVDVATILLRCQKYILNCYEDKSSTLYETAIKAKFSFYHDDPHPEKNGDIIKNSALLPKEDARFCKKGWAFPHHIAFVRGCIKIEPVV